MTVELLSDARYAMRTLRKSPAFAVGAVLVLALGIGSNTAIFSVIEAVILRPLPYRDANSLVLLRDAQDVENGGFLLKDYENLKSQSKTLKDSAIYYRDSGFSRVTFSDGNQPDSVQGAFVSANFFPLMGVPPELGRAFTLEEETQHDRVLLLSHGLWVSRFGASPDVIGKTLQLNGADFQVIGVMPQEFQFPATDQQFWAPLTTNPYWGDPALLLTNPQRARGFYARWQIVSRLRPMVGPEEAQTEINVLLKTIEGADPDPTRALGIKVEPLRVNLSGSARLNLIMLFVAVVFVLLIACTNVANLMFTRGAVRQREMAIRASLGASRTKLFRQLFIESFLLTLIAGMIGLVLAYFGLHLAIPSAPSDLPRLAQTSLDVRVLLFTLAVSLLTAVGCGLLPAWKASRDGQSLNWAARASGLGKQLARARGPLIITQFALTAVLLTGSGLLIRSFLRVEDVNLGFEPTHVLTVHIASSNGSTVSIENLYNMVGLRLRSLPGVQAVGAIDGLFDTGKLYNLGLRSIEGRAPEPKSQWTPLQWNSVRGDFFSAMGIRLLRGRYFTQDDRPNAPLVALIDESMARRYWPNQNPLGQRFKGQDPRGNNDDWITVVGVVSDTRRNGLERFPIPHVYQPYLQAIDGDKTPDFVIRVSGETQELAGASRNVIRQLDPQGIVSPVTSLDEQLSAQLAPRRFQSSLLSLFSFIALLLSVVGIYGLVNYSVALRTHEMGIRIALGARRSDVLRLVITQGIKFAGTGLALGVIVSVGIVKFISALLFGVTSTDPLTFLSVIILLLLVALAACYIPARRATKIDPIVALRYE